jgi:hypothetical protein
LDERPRSSDATATSATITARGYFSFASNATLTQQMRWARVPQALGAVAPATELAPEQALASLPPWTKSETAPHLICIRPSGKMLPRQ